MNIEQQKNSTVFSPELLAPAGNFEKLQAALLYGADAVYLGGTSFNLRASSDGFTHDELCQSVKLAEEKKAKIYFTLNALPMQKDMAKLPEIIEQAAVAGVHGFIVADPGVMRLAKHYAPNIEIHLSTQANTTNSESITFWVEQGVKRVNLARELSCRDIYAIRKTLPEVELEIFIHGAMCLAVSGHCLLSAWLNKRPANLGRCTHPCRFEYKPLGAEPPKNCSACTSPDISLTVSEQTRPDSPLWTVHQGEEYSSFWAPLDLCLAKYLPWFVHNRINSLKIEGRMKGASYVAHVVDAYRFLLNIAQKTTSSNPLTEITQPMHELLHTSTRPLGSGFFLPQERKNFSEHYASNFAPKPLVAKIGQKLGEGKWEVDLRGTWHADKDVCLMLPGLQRPILRCESFSLENNKGAFVPALHSGTRGILYTENEALQTGIFVRQA